MLSSRQKEETENPRWIHPQPVERYHELRTGDGKLASIRWAAGRGTLAHAQWGAHIWSFKRYGFLQPRVMIRREGSDVAVARFEPNLSGGGTLRLESGGEYRLVGNFWRGEWRWTGGGGEDLVGFKRDFSVSEKNEGHLTATSRRLEEERIQLLILLGWYVVIMMADDAANSVL
ncbi:MAG TPA: hypothetical protein VM557_11235 [Thermoanaerobaculia bacterium]|nr:hypothetical protein [Thermoanaerobaculia bacterium]